MSILTESYPIEEIAKAVPPIVCNTFHPDRFSPLGIFDHARETLNQFIANSRDWEVGMVSLVVPVCDQNGGWGVNLPILEVPKIGLMESILNKDEEAKNTINAAKEGSLTTDPLSSTVGSALAYLCGDRNSFDRKTIEVFEADIKSSSGYGWLTLKDPSVRYSSHYKPLTTNPNYPHPDYNMIKPVRLGPGGALMAAIGFDCWGRNPAPVDSMALSIITNSVEALLKSIFWTYYSHIDPPTPELKETMERFDERWRWESSGYVLNSQYLEDFGKYQSQKLKERGTAIVFYCDGNGVKELNDKFGHIIGNEAIRLYGSVLWQSVRECCLHNEEVCIDGFVSKWGGDEFVVLLLVKDDSSLSEVAEYFRSQASRLMECGKYDLEKLINEVDKQDKPSELPATFGISMGWTSFKLGSDSEQFKKAWKQDAEQAMYYCKSMTKLASNRRKQDFSEVEARCFLATLMSHEKVTEEVKNLKALVISD